MLYQAVVSWRRFATLVVLLVVSIIQSWSFSAGAAEVKLAWDPSPDAGVVGYRIYYGPASGSYTNFTTVGATTEATITGLIEGAVYYFAATAFNDNGDESVFSNEVMHQPLAPVNQPPTLDAIANVTINEGAGQQTVNLSGISSGAANETQTLTVTASSSNPTLIPSPTVNYTSPNATGTLRFTPVAFASGTATITVRVNDGGASNNIVTRTFTVTVNPVNQPPTLDALADLELNEGAGQQTINLSGISSGSPNETQTLTVTATSSRPSLIPNPTINYSSPNVTGSIRFTPVAGVGGSATITVTVNDGAATSPAVTRAFSVSVNLLPTITTIADQTVATGALVPPLPFTVGDAETSADSLVVTATSTNQMLMADANLVINGSGANRTLNLLPTAEQTGTSEITLTVSDGRGSTSQTFLFTVRPRPIAPGGLRVVQITP